jgi:hypothetical protein
MSDQRDSFSEPHDEAENLIDEEKGEVGDLSHQTGNHPSSTLRAKCSVNPVKVKLLKRKHIPSDKYGLHNLNLQQEETNSGLGPVRCQRHRDSWMSYTDRHLSDEVSTLMTGSDHQLTLHSE